MNKKNVVSVRWLYLGIVVSLGFNGALWANLQTGAFSESLLANWPFSAQSNQIEVPLRLGENAPQDLFEWDLDELAEISEAQTQRGIWPYRLDVPRVLLSKKQILSDEAERLHPEFRVAENMKDRVGFWFDIYSRYGFQHRVIHHSRYPWIIFDVVDISPELAGRGARWYRVQKGENRVKQRRAEIRKILSGLARKPASKWSAEEKRFADKLASLPGGSLANKANFAVASLRTQMGQKNFFEEGLVRGSEYFPAMEEIFRAKGLPVELTRLPLTESSFNLYATSKVGASGVWQIMPQIGRKFMTMDHRVDERKSPLKSTEVAAKLLKENHMILYRNWPMAVTAYNHGPAGVRRASMAARSRDLGTIVSRYQSKRFSFASSNFFASYQAALHAEMYKDHLFPGLELKEPVQVKEIKLARQTRPRQLKNKYDLTKDEFYRLNPDLRKALDGNQLLPRGLRVFVPEESLVTQADTHEGAGS